MNSSTLLGAMSAGALALTVGSGRAEEPPHLNWDQEVLCLFDGEGKALFAQCDETSRTCLYHRGCQGSSAGDKCRRLERVKDCHDPNEQSRFGSLVAGGYKLVPAIAEAPPGWTRDGSGRVFQTKFDMNKRVWLGGRYAPTFGSSSDPDLGRAAIESGIRGEMLSYDTRSRYRFYALEGELMLNPLQVQATLFRFDQSKEAATPFLRLTTFWPEPQRHDGYLNVGWWAEVMSVSYRPRRSEDETHLRFVGVGPTLDFWHSRDMSSWLRLKVGGALEDLYLDREGQGHRLALTPQAMLDTDVLFDQAGMYRLTVASGYEAPLVFLQGSDAPPTLHHRFRNLLAYEMIVLAINDQPLSLRLHAEGGYRDDLVEEASGWELRAGAGLRVNFWVPPPSAEDHRRIEEKRGK